MATKLQLITAMYDHTVGRVTHNGMEWQRFLRSASRNYKLAFEEQILVHAQRPDATAVLELEKWNTQFARWVNKGATGIAVIDRDYPGKRRLKYFFDVSDTHESHYSRPVPLWEMKPEYEADVIETLEATFGELAEKDTLTDAIIAAANNAVSDNLTDYLQDLFDCRENSFLEELDELNVEVLYRKSLVYSVGFMLMARCGIDPADYFDPEDFQGIHNFNTPDTATLLGAATSAIAEMGLREIASTVVNLQKSERNQIRTFAKPNKVVDNKGATNTERSFEHGSLDLQRSERIQDTRPDPAGRAGDGQRADVWQIRPYATQLSEKPPQGAVLPPADERQAERASDGDSADGDRTDGTDGIADGGGAGRDRGIESPQSDGMGGQDEQHPALGRGNDPPRTDLQVTLFPNPEEQIQRIEEAEGTAKADKPSAFTMSQEIIDEALCHGSGFQYGKFRIYEQYGKSLSTKENIAFLKKEYGIGGYHPAYGIGIGQDHDSKGITVTFGDENKQKNQTFLNWTQAAKRIGELIAAARYLNPREAEVYPAWLEHEEERRQQAAEEAAAREILHCEPISADTAEYRYEYHLGDSVYIGSHEYEVLSFDDSTVRLYDTRFPLINAEFPREEFDRKVRENPMNEHLRAPVKPPQERSARDIYDEYSALVISKVLFDEAYMNARANSDEQNARTECEAAIGRVALEIGLDNTDFLRAYSDEPWFKPELTGHVFQKTYTDLIPAQRETLAGEVTPRILYRKYLPLMVKEIQNGELYDFLRDRNTDVLAAETEIGKELDLLAESYRQDDPAFFAAYDSSPQFREWLVEDILDLIYQDHPKKSRDSLTQHEADPGSPDPAKRPELAELVREDLYERGFVVSDELIDTGIMEYRAHGGQGNSYEDIADFIENEFLSDEEGLEQELGSEGIEEPESYTPRPGDRYEIQGRLFEVDSVNEEWGNVSLRDVTFQTGAGFPIFRKESLEFIRMYSPIKEDTEPQKATAHTVDVIKTPLFDVELVELRFPQTEQIEPTITPAWEKNKKAARVNYFDAFPDVPMSERHNFKITDDNLGHGGAKAKFRANMDAIHLLHDLEFDGRLATPQQQEILSRYVGWGSLQDAFKEKNPGWENEFTELYTALSPQEYESARATTLNAHYTTPIVIKAIYKTIENMGFRTGNILDPGCGVGNFQGLLPDSMSGSKVFGIEIDPITGRIAQQLYQKNSIAIQGYENTALPDSFFDLAIGNVPFGGYGVSDKKYDKHKFHIHDYFFAKTLDKVRPGGVMAFVTSSWTMDKKNPAVRQYIAQRAELLGAIRLPNNAFLANAGTQVTTDILFLQKRDRQVEPAPDSPSAAWLHLDEIEDAGNPGDTIAVNAYFAQHPEMILGTMGKESGTRMYGNENSTTCMPLPDRELSDLLAEAIQNIHAEITDIERNEDEQEQDDSIPADPTVRNFSFTLVNGQIYYRQNSRMYPKELSATAQSRVKGMIGIRECVRRLISYQTEDYPENDIKAEQAALNRLYDGYTKKYGILNDRANNMAFSEDESYPLLCSLEVLDENLKFKAKADMFTKRTIKPYRPITHVDTASEALAVSIGERAKVDLDFMSKLTGKQEAVLVKELEGVIFFNIGGATEPDKLYVTADEYLSGNIREKLKLAKGAAATFPDGRYDINVTALEAVQPKDLTAPEISVRLGATWIPLEIYQQFIYELLNTGWRAQSRIKVLYCTHTAEWNITEKSADRENIKSFNTFGTSRINAYHIIENTLNLRTVRVFDTVYDPDGKERQVLNKKETAIAQDKQDTIKAQFAEWIWKDPDRRERLCKLYNSQFNSVRPREYDGQHIKFHGMNPEIKLDKHQVNAAARHIYGGNALFGHVVGAGKSYEMIAAGMESKRLGLSNKPMYVVPNNIVADFASDFFKLYPSANVLMATAKDFEKKNRKKFCARISTGDYDGVIIAHSQFEKIPMSLERQRLSLQQQMRDIAAGIEEVKRQKGERFTIKQMERAKKALQVKLDKLNDQSRKDSLVTFEELGVDSLFIDEADLFKNLYLVTKMRNVGGIAQSDSQKASDLFMKTRYLDDLTGNRGTVFATGTPVSNTLAEVYTMQRYLQYDTLLRHGLQHFDCWASTFGETVTAMELTPEGSGFQMKTRFSSFYNLPELMAMFKEVADIQTKDMLNLPTPKVNYHTVVTKPSEMQKEMIAGLAERAERIRRREVDSSEDNMLLITNDGRKIALDQRIINPMLPDHPESKVNACTDNVFRIWEETKEKRLTQLVFSDLSTPKGNGTFSVYEDIRAKLIQKGIPEEEIAFIHDAKNEAQKKEIVAKVRSGTIRVLMGSTSKMGAGMNAQDLLYASHDLDCPWRPRDLEQRAGRIERRGNQNPEVHLYRYVTEGTFDAYCYQIIENKQRGISQVFTSKSPARIMQEIDEVALNYAEIKALATGNPLIIERCSLEGEVNKLKTLKSAHLSQRYDLEDRIYKSYPAEIKRISERIAGYEKDAVHATAHPKPEGDAFVGMTVGDRFIPDKKAAGTAILEACKAMTNPDAVPLGEYRGFPMHLSFDTFGKVYKVDLKGTLTHTVDLGVDIHGNITRLDNALDGMEPKLQSYREQLEAAKVQFETAKVEAKAPFPREQELTGKTARLAELTVALKLNEQDHELLDAAPDAGDNLQSPARKKEEYER